MSITFEEANQLRIQLLSKFRESDLDENGMIDWVEFRTLMTELDPTMSESEMRNLFDRMDVSKDSFIEYEDVFHEDSDLWPLVLSAAFKVDIEYEQSKEESDIEDDVLTGSAAKSSDPLAQSKADFEFQQMKEQMFALLQATDVNDDGLTDFDEFTKAMRSVLRTVTKREIKQLFDVMDFDKTGEIDYKAVFGSAASQSEESSGDSTDSRSAAEKLSEKEMQRQRDNRLRLLFDEISTRAQRAGGDYDSEDESSDEAERYIREKDEELERARQEIDELHETYDDYKRNTDDMIRQLSTMQDERHDQVSHLTDHIESLEGELNAHKMEVVNLNEHIETLEKKITLMKKEHSEDRERWKSERIRLEGETQEWHSKAKDFEKKMTQLMLEKDSAELSRRMDGSQQGSGLMDGARGMAAGGSGGGYMIAGGLAERSTGGGIDLETALSARRVSGIATDLIPAAKGNATKLDINGGLYDEVSSGDSGGGVTAKEIEETKEVEKTEHLSKIMESEDAKVDESATTGRIDGSLPATTQAVTDTAKDNISNKQIGQEKMNKLAALIEDQQTKMAELESELLKSKELSESLTEDAQKAEWNLSEMSKKMKEKENQIEKLENELQGWKEKVNSAHELRNELDERDAELERVRTSLVDESSRKRQSELHVRQLLQEKYEKIDHEKVLMDLENEYSQFKFDKETEISILNDNINQLSYDLDLMNKEVYLCVRSKNELAESAAKEILRLKSVSEEMKPPSEVDSESPSWFTRIVGSLF